MTTGCCEPRQAGSQDTRVETERRRGPYQRLVVRSHRPARRTQAPPCTTGQGKNRAAPVSRQRPADREPPRTRRHRRTGQRTGRPPRGPGHPHDRTRAKDLSVSTYISSPCRTPPRIRPPAPPLLVFPHPAALWRPLIPGGLRRAGPLLRRVSRFPLAYAGCAGSAPPIRGGVEGIRGGLNGLYGRPPVCRSNPVGSRARVTPSPNTSTRGRSWAWRRRGRRVVVLSS